MEDIGNNTNKKSGRKCTQKMMGMHASFLDIHQHYINHLQTGNGFCEGFMYNLSITATEITLCVF